jgi:hypothetical protein
MPTAGIFPPAGHDSSPAAAGKVRIPLTGIMGRQWAGYYWFRWVAGLFLCYEGICGLPGTTKAVINPYRSEDGC